MWERWLTSQLALTALSDAAIGQKSHALVACRHLRDARSARARAHALKSTVLRRARMRNEQQVQREADQSLRELRDEAEAIDEQQAAEHDVTTANLGGSNADLHELFVANCPWDASDEAIMRVVYDTANALFTRFGYGALDSGCFVACEPLITRNQRVRSGGQRFVLVRGECVANVLAEGGVPIVCGGRTLRVGPSTRNRSAQKDAAKAIPLQLKKVQLLDMWAADSESFKPHAHALTGDMLWHCPLALVRPAL